MADSDTVINWIENSREEMVEMLLEFGNIPSPRGHEAKASQYLYEWMETNELNARQQQVIEDRSNVIGTLRGDPDEESDTLLFNGHIDTAYGNPEEDEWVLPRQRRIDTEAWREGPYLMGDDVVNDKGPMVAFLFAALALKENDISLEGDLHVTGTIGEIGGTNVDEFQDVEYLGTGLGTRRLVDGGVTADYALVAECTDYAIARMECGVAWFKITLTQSATYQPLLALEDPESIEEDHTGVVPDMARASLVLERWASEYTRDHTREYDHGTVRPTAGVGALRTGNPYAPAKAPGKGTLYFDVRLPPGKTPEFVLDDIRARLANEGIEATVDPYMFRRGYMADGDRVAGLTDTIETAHDTVRDDELPRPAPHVTSMWRDSNVFNEVGIPSVNFGPPRSEETISATVKNNALHIDDLVDTAKIYAKVAMDVCGS